MGVPHRVRIFERDGLWYYKVQGRNWATLEVAPVGAKRTTVERIVARRWPNLEVVVEP
jgi:hypothetical protein